MPLQNRVGPDGAITADPARGTMMGNRGGRLHDADRRLGRRRWAGKAWICCRLDFRQRRRQVMGPGYTELFFLDEATALAAGHRPCFECRREAALRFRELWRAAHTVPGSLRAREMDAALHAERCGGRPGRLMGLEVARRLPDGAFVMLGEQPLLAWQGRLHRWTMAGYAGTLATAGADGPLARLLTPPSTLAVLAAGYSPEPHASLPASLALGQGVVGQRGEA